MKFIKNILNNSRGALIPVLISIYGHLITIQAQDTSLFEIPTGSLTVPAACQLALQNNPGVKEALQSLETAEARLNQARSTFLPTLTLDGSGTSQRASMQPDWEPTTRGTENFYDFHAGVSVSWVLYDGFSRRANALAEAKAIEEQIQQLREVQRLLLEAVATAWYQASLAREYMIVARENYQFNKSLEKSITARWEAGEAAESDKLNFSIRALEAETAFRQSSRDLNLAATILASLMALPDVELPDDYFPCSLPAESGNDRISYDDVLQYALDHRPELQQIAVQQEILKHKKHAVKGKNYPALAVIGGIEYTRQNETGPLNQNENNRYIGLAVKWDIFDGNRRKAQIEELQSLSRTLDYSRQRKVLEIRMEIRNSLQKIETTRAVLKDQNTAHEQSAKIVQAVMQAWEAGEIPITRVNEVQTNHVRIAGNLAAARIRSQLARIELETATGRILEQAKEIHIKNISKKQLLREY